MLVPGLAADFAGYAATALPAAPALSTWLRRAVVDTFTATLTEQAVTTLCGFGDAITPPVGALSYLDDFGELPAGYCLRVDPVHLRADTGGLILFDTTSFELNVTESRALTGTLSEHLAMDGWTLEHRHPQRWYLVGGRAPDLVTTPLPAVRNTLVSSRPFDGGDAPGWIARLNEMQMLMHNHPVNQARAAAGQVTVNSLWLWGGADLPTPPPTAVACNRVVSDNPFVRGCARYCELPLAPLRVAPGAEPARARLVAAERRLVVLEDCRAAAAYEDIAAWQTALERLERDWFGVLLRALKTGRLDQLDLIPLNGRRYRLTRRRLLAFWKGRPDYRGERYFRHHDANRV